MTFGMEFHDSRLLDMCCEGDGKGFALFHAYVYRSEGRVFQDAQESGWQNVRFHLEGMHIDGVFGEFGEYAADGNLWVNGSNGNGVTLLPADHVGEICLELCLSPLFDTVKIYASRISSTFEGDFKLESTWVSDGNKTSVR
jgi:hypothetical protein